MLSKMGSLDYLKLLEDSKYRNFLHRTFPFVDRVEMCHCLMKPLIYAARNCRSGFVEFGCDAWTANPWIFPLISRNLKLLTMKLESLILSTFKYARPDWKITDSDWCEAFFDNRQFVGSFGIFQNDDENFLHDLMSVKVRVRFLTNRRRSGQIPIMNSSVNIELTFEEIVDEQVLRPHFSAHTFQNGYFHTEPVLL